MAGKRKREAVVVRRESQSSGAEDEPGHSDVFQRYFESVFEPLPKSRPDVEEASDSSQEDLSEVEDEWEGFSDDDGSTSPVIQVIEHNTELASDANPSSSTEFKAFMSSRPPKESRAVGKPKAEFGSGDESETLNLKHDLDLQRLLKESHLFERGNSSMADTTATGPQRHRATDLRIQNLGARGSLFEQDKMPMSHRKGIEGKKRMREGKRREEAKENNIILEKKQRTSVSTGKRDKGVDAPGLGRFRGGTLKLSKSDIAGMQGPSRSLGGHRGKR